MNLHFETPLVESRALSVPGEQSVWLKLDALQPCGSFKIRGIGHACAVQQSRGAQRFVSSSGGNAGLAVAYAGRRLGIPVLVVVPETTTERAKELLRREGAEVVVHGGSWQEANQFAQTLLGATDAFLHPFDDPLLWHGHASMIDEVAQARFKPDAVVLSVGGGGLLAGVVEGLQRNRWHDVPVLAVETDGAASLHAAVEAGHTVALPCISSVATSLGAKRVCEQALRCVREHPVHSLVVSDSSALAACERFLADHRILVEPACGAALSVAYDRHPALARYKRILVVVCGGATATIDQIRAWASEAESR
ncbi:pyridoxal-phosphate dependent enzyme [Paraburkholderia sp. CNPSo 3076]|uniref:pyridoxal-phosphate dependent enzyme n=1 Tax=Paraburkholderia sp. CNPSo 3076 TaxID=2940936 RepID=UPI00225160BE|nr:pyridoxal-phosphate dependent enzyme [Paraburkholderia sp. CNPSo 3076]MCX5539034.1 pyridoxal-phosphate dependent enzyme [Paraburkholderia sp. CNPSo 3076]